MTAARAIGWRVSPLAITNCLASQALTQLAQPAGILCNARIPPQQAAINCLLIVYCASEYRRLWRVAAQLGIIFAAAITPTASASWRTPGMAN